jgi:hypothetical protein
MIARQQSTTKVRQLFAKQPFEIVRIALADTQSGVDPATAENNPPQLRAISSSMQM